MEGHKAMIDTLPLSLIDRIRSQKKLYNTDYCNGINFGLELAVAAICQHEAEKDTNSPVSIHPGKQSIQTDTLNRCPFCAEFPYPIRDMLVDQKYTGRTLECKCNVILHRHQCWVDDAHTRLETFDELDADLVRRWNARAPVSQGEISIVSDDVKNAIDDLREVLNCFPCSIDTHGGAGSCNRCSGLDSLEVILAASKRESGEHERLGRFRHHPDPAIDFCCEVDFLEGRVRNVQCGMDTKEDVAKEIFTAMQFRVGGDPRAIKAKDLLRDLEATLNSIEGGQS